MSATNSTSIIDWNLLEGLEPKEFQSVRPYPWLNPQGALKGKPVEGVI